MFGNENNSQRNLEMDYYFHFWKVPVSHVAINCYTRRPSHPQANDLLFQEEHVFHQEILSILKWK